MPTVSARGRGVACSSDGRRLVWSEPGKVVVIDLVERMRLAEVELELEPPVELAIAGPATQERLLVLQPKGGGTQMRVFAMPGVDPLVNARLRGESRVAAVCGASAILVAGETVTVLDLADLRTATLPVRGPLQLTAAVADDQLLVGTRGKLEAWNLSERRPTHKVGLPMPSDATFAGSASGKLFWFASPAAPGTVRVHRMTDGKQLPDLAAGGAIKAIAADPNSPALVALVEIVPGKPQLVALDIEAQTRRVLPHTGEIAAFCLAGSPATGVVVCGADGAPMLISLTSELPAQPIEAGDSAAPHDAEPDPNTSRVPVAVPAPEPSTPPVGDTGLADKLRTWRNQLHAAMQSAPLRATVGAARGGDEPQSRSRAELHAWGQAARNRSTTTPPPPPYGWRLNELVTRFKLDTESKTLLALLYTSWLDGEGKTGLPVAVIARALGNDEDAWIEALAQGRLGHMGWIRSTYGRTRLHPVVGRFLDEAPPRIALITPAEENPSPVAPPTGPALLELGDGIALDEHVRELADWLGGQVATIDAAALPAARRDRALTERILEARLAGALPVIVAGDWAIDPAAFDGPVLLAVRGLVPESWGTLPVWPPAPAADLRPPAA